MAGPLIGECTLFVAWEPSTGPDDSAPRLTARLLSFIAPPVWVMPAGRPSSSPEELPWRLPADQASAVLMVGELAAQLGQKVRLVDVNRPGEDGPLVDRFVTPELALPILVRPDGKRIWGIESFTASNVRRFLSGR